MGGNAREGCIYVAEAGRGCPAKMCSHSKYAVDKADGLPERHCHVNWKFAGQVSMAATVHAATVAWRHVSNDLPHFNY